MRNEVERMIEEQEYHSGEEDLRCANIVEGICQITTNHCPHEFAEWADDFMECEDWEDGGKSWLEIEEDH